MAGFRNSILSAAGRLVRAAIRSPNFITGISGWSINKDGSAEFQNIILRGTFNGVDWQLTSQGLFFYAGSPATGNLVASIAPQAGTNDGYGNAFPAGFAIGQPGSGQIQLQPNVNQAFDISTAITGMFTAMAQYFTGDSNQVMPSMLGSVLLGAGTATKMSAIMHSPFAAQGAVMLLESQNDGGTDTPVITFGTVTMPDGMTMVFVPIMTLTPFALVLYSGSGTHTIVTKTSGSGTIPIPVGVTTAKAECWAGGGGGGGGSTIAPDYVGGTGGGGGEYAQEPNLTVTGGGTVSYSVGAGGSGVPAGNSSATAGGNSTITGSSVTVTAHGAAATGTGGSGSTNTTHFNGGAGAAGTISASFDGGSGAGGSAGISSAGNNGSFNSGSTGGNGGVAVSGGGRGGNGGNVGSAGVAGSAPGGGGGGGSSQSSGQTAGGAGAHGQVRLTYTNGTPPVGFSINFGAAFTDQFGTSIPAGINTAAQFTGTVTLPDGSTLSSNGIHVATTLWGNAGTLTVGDNIALAAGGMAGKPAITNAVQGGNTNNTTSLSDMFTAFSIPLNDAKNGTTYRITCGGHGTQAATTAVALNFQLSAFGLAWGASTDTGGVPAGAGFHWRFTGELIMGAPGASAGASFIGEMTISQSAASAQGHPTAMDQQRASGVNTTANTSISFQAGWASVTGSPTLVCTGAVLERMGP